MKLSSLEQCKTVDGVFIVYGFVAISFDNTLSPHCPKETCYLLWSSWAACSNEVLATGRQDQRWIHWKVSGPWEWGSHGWDLCPHEKSGGEAVFHSLPSTLLGNTKMDSRSKKKASQRSSFYCYSSPRPVIKSVFLLLKPFSWWRFVKEAWTHQDDDSKGSRK